MTTYKFIITGMTCHACEELIKMDLEDAGLPQPTTIDASAGVMTIDLEEDQVEKVKRVINETEKYNVLGVQPL